MSFRISYEVTGRHGRGIACLGRDVYGPSGTGLPCGDPLALVYPSFHVKRPKPTFSLSVIT
jgi:hypothetical protein